MILAIDIGNTTMAFGVMRQLSVMHQERIDTVQKGNKVYLQVKKTLRGLIKKYPLIRKVIICSVVPSALVFVEKGVKEVLHINPVVVGRQMVVPIKNGYNNPAQVGQDRLVGAYAGLKLYGKPLIIIDLGTAITFDIVSVKGEYLGGVIVPGIRLSAESLFLKTALLPKIDIKAPDAVIGKTTQESILSGLFYGYGSLCNGMVDLLSRRISSRRSKVLPHVIMTGGHTRLMKKFISPKIRITDEHLVFKGMVLLLTGLK